MELDIHDIKDAERVINDDKFSQYLLSHTTTFGAAAFILQTLFVAVDNAKAELQKED